MVTRDTAWQAGTPCWVDLGADVQQAATFYRALFGWQVEQLQPPEMGYWGCTLDGRRVAGLGTKQDDSQPSAWTTYLGTDDADDTVARVKAAGGQVLVEPMDIAEEGRMAIAVDPAGAVFGIWQSGRHTGVEVANELGAITWNENMTGDFEGNQKFYADVFGYSYDDMSAEGFQYATMSVGGSVVGGIGKADGHPHWMTYFAVENTDATVAKVQELGGTVVTPAKDTPYGRMATVTDDQGTTFSVMDQSRS
jgi:predicted enzyme related to lactoylglutathione lyase